VADIHRKAADFGLLVRGLDEAAGAAFTREEALSIARSALCDALIFKYLLQANCEALSFNNLALDSRQVRVLGALVSQHSPLFVPFEAYFGEMIVRLARARPLTFRSVRGALLVFCFLPLLTGASVSKHFCQFLKQLFEWPEEARRFFFDARTDSPELLNAARVIVQTNLTLWSLCIAADPKLRLSRLREEKLVKRRPRALTGFLQELREAVHRNNSLPDVVDFANEPFTSLVTIDFTRSMDSFLNARSALTLGFRNSLLTQYCAEMQQRLMHEDILARGLNISIRDLQFFLEVSRSEIVSDTLATVQRVDQMVLLKKLTVVFKGEQAVDAGGVSREFFYLLCNDAFSPDYGLFRRVTGGKYWFRSDPLQSPIFFNLLGTIVGVALYNSVVLPIRFPRLLYKKLCKKALRLSDLAEIAPEILESLTSLIQMREDGEDIADCGLTFAITLERLDRGDPIYPLKVGGESIAVTNSNLGEYVDLYSNYLMNASIEHQFSLFERGFLKVCPSKNATPFPLRLFEYDELDLLVSGVDVLDWSELKANAQYTDGYTSESPIVQWFWEVFDEMSDEQRRWLLRFATGTDRTPITGLSDVRLVIQRAGDPDKLPVAHTCFSILTLPDYPSKEALKTKLLIAVENNEGFGLI
jgi:hypothetical protein